MSRGAKKVRVCLIFLLTLLMLLPACIQIQAPTRQVVTPPVVVITQIVTEMIPPTPVPVTPTIAPSATPLPPTVTPTWDPLLLPFTTHSQIVSPPGCILVIKPWYLM